MKKFIAVLLSLVILLSLAACGSPVSSDEDFKAWFNESLSPAYDSFIKTEGGQDAAYPNVSLMLASDVYINAVFDYIESGAQPSSGSVTQEGEAYIYENGFKQKVELNKDDCSIRVTMFNEYEDITETEFVAVFRQEKDEFYIQYHWTMFGELHEICFTAEGGRATVDSGAEELSYSIFDEDIPEDFAK